MLCRRLPLFFSFLSLIVVLTAREAIFLLGNKNSISKRDENNDIQVLSPTGGSDDADNGQTNAPLHTVNPLVYGELAARFSNRSEYLRAKCAEFQGNLPGRLRTWLPQALYYSQKYNILGCLIAKAGVTTWKVHLNRMLGRDGNLENTDDIKAIKMMPLSKLTRLVIAGDVTRVINVRHPIDRLVSAYKNKFYNGQPTIPGEKFTNFFQKAQKLLGRPWQRGTATSISFPEFLQYVLEESKSGLSTMNCHWRPIHSVCLPCTAKYKYIMKLETIEEDLAFLKEELDIREMNVTLKMNVNKKQEGRTSDDYFRGLPVDLLAGVRRLYEYDFTLFDYAIPDYLENIG
ncbi:chondroitin 4-sulfotransferase [Penaeus vannamei]|uniref:Carbohydrate sulfotransferase n=1 Tax=Penaeus vannamei TaxID=6689 RepID=A0A3R7M4H3_PENVA|nr:carbohydrate sulfotransferase 11-like [Penaeus vannamei]ROT72651.1 chondroitin 4-sulfotransferase [Penaeus vannamei]